ncbi:hypothetical protein EBZ37_12295, partial [bacterium]|nr:hypothetical protein [bacterium]
MGGSSSKQDEETKKKVEALKLKYFDKRHGAALSKVQKTDVQLEFFEKVEKDENELKVILVEASKVLGKYADKAQEQEGNIAKMENAFLFFVSWHLAQKLANNDKWNATTKTSELQAIALYAFKQLDSIAKNTQKKLSKKFEAEISKGQELGKEIELYENFLNSAKGISLVQMLCAAFKAKGPMRHKPLHAKFTQNYDKTLAFMNFHYMDDNINGNQLFEAAQKFYGYICKKTYPLQQMKEYTDVDMPDYIFPYLLGMWPIFPQAEYEVRNPETGAKEKTPGDIEDLLRYHLEALDKYHVDDEESTSVAPVSKSSSSIRQAPLTLGTATDWLAENAADLTQD